MKPQVTVILPTYNWSSVLRHAIASVLRQTFTDFELLVIGDGCTDDSAQVAAESGDPRVRWIGLPENSGHQSGPNNDGTREARGEIIAYHGHDDLWLPHHLAVMVEALQSSGADLAHSLCLMVPHEGESGWLLDSPTGARRLRSAALRGPPKEPDGADRRMASPSRAGNDPSRRGALAARRRGGSEAHLRPSADRNQIPRERPPRRLPHPAPSRAGNMAGAHRVGSRPRGAPARPSRDGAQQSHGELVVPGAASRLLRQTARRARTRLRFRNESIDAIRRFKGL